MVQIGVIGAGAWGTALAQSFASDGKDVLLWVREMDLIEDINNIHENTHYLPGIKLDEKIKATDSLTEVSACHTLLFATPAQYLRATLQSLKANIGEGKPFVICAKGVELETGYLMSQIVDEVVPGASFAILTGPTFAREIGSGLPSAFTLAIEDKDVGQEIVDAITTKNLRPYVTSDVMGAQIGGAVKNVIAIASGIVTGRSLGESARAALVTRGLAEMGRLTTAMGGKRETLMGQCGVGDLILTCTSPQSRNFSFGLALGKGGTKEDVLKDTKSVTEGVSTSKALMTMAKTQAVDMPISKAVYRILNEDLDIDEAIEQMFQRPLKKENG